MSRVRGPESRIKKLKEGDLIALICLGCGSTGWNPRYDGGVDATAT
jgi:hypothetical protein